MSTPKALTAPEGAVVVDMVLFVLIVQVLQRRVQVLCCSSCGGLVIAILRRLGSWDWEVAFDGIVEAGYFAAAPGNAT